MFATSKLFLRKLHRLQNSERLFEIKRKKKHECENGDFFEDKIVSDNEDYRKNPSYCAEVKKRKKQVKREWEMNSSHCL